MPAHRPLPTLLSQVVVAFTIEHDNEADGQRVRDLPLLAGVSKEAMSVSLGFLERRGYAGVEPDPAASRGKVARLTPKGREARDAADRVVGTIEERWQLGAGAGVVERLRATLDVLLDHPDFSDALVPPPGGWRARKPYAAQSAAFVEDPRAALPHHPMVSHRGGWPDGS